MKFYLSPCACGRFIHCISISFRRFVHSVALHSLHYPSLHSVCVHFTNLSTAQQKWLIHSAALIHAVPFRKPCLSNPQGSGVNKSYHCLHSTKAQSCSIPPGTPVPLHSIATFASIHHTMNIGMLYFFCDILPQPSHE